MWIFVIIKKKTLFWSKFSKMSVSLKRISKSQQWSKFSKNLDFSHIFFKSRFLSKFSGIISGFLSKFLIISYLVQIFDIPNFVQNFRKITISLKIFKESRFWSKLFKISIIVNLYTKIVIFVNSSENLDFSRDFRNISILVELLKKTSDLVNFSEKKIRLRKKSSKISIVVKDFGNLHFGQNFRETSVDW